MRDIVWAIGPRNNELGEVILRVRQFASDVLEAKGIQWDFAAQKELDNIKLGSIMLSNALGQRFKIEGSSCRRIAGGPSVSDRVSGFDCPIPTRLARH